MLRSQAETARSRHRLWHGQVSGLARQGQEDYAAIPVRDKSDRDDGTFSRSDFRWDKRGGHYICPNGKVLRTSGTIHGGRTLLYRASKLDCDVCLLKAKCCPKEPARKIPRDLHEDARDVARRKMNTKA